MSSHLPSPASGLGSGGRRPHILATFLIGFLGVASLQANSLESLPLVQMDSVSEATPQPFQLRPDTRYLAFYYSASWCGPCQVTTPALVEEYLHMQRAETRPVEIIFVSSDSSEKQMLAYMKQYGMTWPTVPWPERGQADAFASTGIPHLALIDRESGAVIARGTGSTGSGSVESVVDEIRRITGDTTRPAFRTSTFWGRYGVLLAIGLSFLLILIIQKWKTRTPS